MSALIISTRVGEYHRSDSYQPVRTPRRALEQPNYAARRIGAVFVALSAVFLAISFVGAVVDGIAGTPASAAGADVEVVADVAGQSVVVPATHVAVPGDSLWSIADQYRGSVDRDRFVDALERLNGGTGIFVGQAVILP